MQACILWMRVFIDFQRNLIVLRAASPHGCKLTTDIINFFILVRSLIRLVTTVRICPGNKTSVSSGVTTVSPRASCNYQLKEKEQEPCPLEQKN
jgi:hypothetical protein